jgi:hypothetical protein
MLTQFCDSLTQVDFRRGRLAVIYENWIETGSGKRVKEVNFDEESKPV